MSSFCGVLETSSLWSVCAAVELCIVLPRGVSIVFSLI